MRFVRDHPGLAYRNCDECKLYVYNKSGEIQKRNGKPEKRPSPPNCSKCKKFYTFGGEVKDVVKELHNLYGAVKMLGGIALPRKGDLWDQHKLISQALFQMAVLEYAEEVGYRDAMLNMPRMF